MGEFIRDVNHQIETAILQFQHRETDNEVAVVSCLPFGTETYYKHIGDFVQWAEGESPEDGRPKVYRDVIAPSDDLAEVAAPTRRALERRRGANDFYNRSVEKLMRDGLGLITQTEGLRGYGSSWEACGVSELDVVQGLGVEEVNRWARSDRWAGILNNTPSPFIGTRARAISLLKRAVGREDIVTLPDERSRTFIDAIDRSSERDTGRSLVFVADIGLANHVARSLYARDFRGVVKHWQAVTTIYPE